MKRYTCLGFTLHGVSMLPYRICQCALLMTPQKNPKCRTTEKTPAEQRTVETCVRINLSSF